MLVGVVDSQEELPPGFLGQEVIEQGRADPADVQRARVLARPGMTAAALDLILSRQLPDAEKRARADYVIDTTSLASAEAGIERVMADIGGRIGQEGVAGRSAQSGIAARGITAP